MPATHTRAAAPPVFGPHRGRSPAGLEPTIRANKMVATFQYGEPVSAHGGPFWVLVVRARYMIAITSREMIRLPRWELASERCRALIPVVPGVLTVF